jgi:hypothetical protein
MISKDKLKIWQENFSKCQQCWIVRVEEHETGYGETGNLYDSKESAMLEVEFRKKQGQRAYVEFYGNLHTFELAKERWSEKDERDEPKWSIEDCRKHNVQACHICPDVECCDNVNSELKKKI